MFWLFSFVGCQEGELINFYQNLFHRCPVNGRVITEFKYDESKGHADATLFSMFRLPDSRELHFQCDVAICKGK